MENSQGAPALIRAARSEDLSAINALFAEEQAWLRRLYPRRFNKELKKPTQKPGEFLDLLAEDDPKERYRVAEINGQVVGFIDLSFENDEATNWMRRRRTVWVDDIAVAATYRRQGIARLLMAEADIWAKEKKADWIELSVHEKNLGARRLYEGSGYVPYTTRMCKQVTSD